MWTANEDFPTLENEVKIGRYPTAPQLKKLAVALFRGEKLTPASAYDKYGCMRLSERMRELQALGWGISKAMTPVECRDGSVAHVMSYWL